MLVLTYRYRLYPDMQQELHMDQWLEACRGVYNYAVRERKDWIKSRRCAVNACSLQSEYIIRFKKFGQYKSFLFPQVKAGDIEGSRIRIPKIGWVDLKLHRPTPEGFVPKTFRIIRKARVAEPTQVESENS